MLGLAPHLNGFLLDSAYTYVVLSCLYGSLRWVGEVLLSVSFTLRCTLDVFVEWSFYVNSLKPREAKWPTAVQACAWAWSSPLPCPLRAGRCGPASWVRLPPLLPTEWWQYQESWQKKAGNMRDERNGSVWSGSPTSFSLSLHLADIPLWRHFANCL